ncbi:MAG: DUF4397 domain-containing protein [Actinobacteria bacterium]|nr:DUF4397 domain-containing protein [Actinomycetota bacterium]
MRRWLVPVAVLSLLLVLARVGGVAAADAGTAQVRVAHFSPDTGGVDVYVDGHFLLGNVNYRTVSDYATVAAGSHLLELRPVGASPTSPPAVSSNAVLEAGHAYTVAGVGPHAQLHGVIFDDDLSAPASGEAKARLVNATVGDGPVELKFSDASTVFPQTDFPAASPYLAVRPGEYDVTVLASSSGSTLDDAPQVDFGAGITYTLVAIGGAGQPVRVLPVVDARGSAVTPVGGAATGGGGTAPAALTEPLTLVSATVAACGIGLLVTRRRRTPTR